MKSCTIWCPDDLRLFIWFPDCSAWTNTSRGIQLHGSLAATHTSITARGRYRTNSGGANCFPFFFFGHLPFVCWRHLTKMKDKWRCVVASTWSHSDAQHAVGRCYSQLAFIQNEMRIQLWSITSTFLSDKITLAYVGGNIQTLHRDSISCYSLAKLTLCQDTHYHVIHFQAWLMELHDKSYQVNKIILQTEKSDLLKQAHGAGAYALCDLLFVVVLVHSVRFISKLHC